MQQGFLQGSFASVATLIPEADTKDETRIADDAALFACKRRRLPEGLRVRIADVGRELAAELVADAQPGIEFRKPGPDIAARIALAVEIHLDLGLRNEAVRDQ